MTLPYSHALATPPVLLSVSLPLALFPTFSMSWEISTGPVSQPLNSISGYAASPRYLCPPAFLRPILEITPTNPIQ